MFCLVFAGTMAMNCMGKSAEQCVREQADRRQIIEHVRSIFEAYIRKDREAVRRTHSEDWVGFLAPSTKIERGIGDYMAHADRALQGPSRGAGYELLDTEIQLYGDLALLYYVARWDRMEPDGKITPVLLRSIDVYRRDPGGWIQCGSHITGLPKADVALDGTRPVGGETRNPDRDR